MSEEKKTPVKNAQPGKAAKILNWFKTLPQRIAKPFKSMYYELKKVTWPTKQRLVSYSIIVLVFMLFMSVVIGLLDMGASAGVRSLISATTVADNLNMALYFLVLLGIAGSAFFRNRYSHPHIDEVASKGKGDTETLAEDVEEAAETAEKTVEEAAGTAEKAAEGAAETAQNAAEGK